MDFTFPTVDSLGEVTANSLCHCLSWQSSERGSESVPLSTQSTCWESKPTSCRRGTASIEVRSSGFALLSQLDRKSTLGQIRPRNIPAHLSKCSLYGVLWVWVLPRNELVLG